MKIHQISTTDFITKLLIGHLSKHLTLLLVPTTRLVWMHNLKHIKVYEVKTLSCVTGKKSERGTLLGRVSFNYKPSSTPVPQYRKQLKSVKPPKTAKASVSLRCSCKASPGGTWAEVRRGAARPAAWGRRPGGRRGPQPARHYPRALPRELSRLFPPHAFCVLWYLLQPRLGMDLFTRVRRRKLLSATVFASCFMLLSRRYFNLKKHE